MYDIICPLPSPYLLHQCDIPGCKDVIVIDGIAKIYRPMCAAPPEAIKIPDEIPKHANFQRFFSSCIHDPIRPGGRGHKKQKLELDINGILVENEKELEFDIEHKDDQVTNINECTVTSIVEQEITSIELPISTSDDNTILTDTTDSIIVNQDNDINKKDIELSYKGFCNEHQYCRNPHWRRELGIIDKDEQKRTQQLLEQERKHQQVIDLTQQLDDEYKQSTDGIGFWVTEQDIKQLRATYKAKLKQGTNEIYFNGKKTKLETKKAT